MWRSSTAALLLAGLALAPALQAARAVGPDRGGMFSGKSQRRPPAHDGVLREVVDEAQGLFDALARESRRLPREESQALAKELRGEYKLPEAEDRARRCLGLAEDTVGLQEAIKAQQDRLKGAAAEDMDREEQKLLGLQSDLMGNVEDLRKTLRSLIKDLKEDGMRELRNWLMINEGMLRRRREDAEAAAKLEAAAQALSPSAETLPIDAGTLAPPPAGVEKR
jgi:hypothetical protein